MTVADDGGSSGVLREELGIPPVGDIRNCIAALADAEPLMSELLQYRFPARRRRRRGDGGLGGHALGNLLIAAMTAVEGGDFEEGVRLMNRILAVRGQVVPVSRDAADAPRASSPTDRSSTASRRSCARAGIERVWVTPDDVRASEDALAAIADAELIVLGPGSLYTSLLPSLLIPRSATPSLRAPAPRVFVCNVATQDGETTGFDLAAHVEALVGAHRPGARRRRPRQQPVRTPAGRRRGWTAPARGRPPALAAGGRSPRRGCPRRRRRPGQRPPPRPGPARGRGHPRATSARAGDRVAASPDGRRGRTA